MKKILYLLITSILLLNTSSINAETIDGRFYPTRVNVVAAPPQSINNLAGHFDHKINFVFSDIDGTLIPFSKTGPRAVMPESVKQAAQKLKGGNIPLVLVTGRSSWEAVQIAKRLENGTSSYIIAQQGTQIVNPEGKIIYEDNISHKTSLKILKDIEKFEKMNNKKLNVFIYLNGNLYTVGNFDLPYIIQKINVINSFKDIDKIKPNYALNKIGIYSYDMKELRAIQSFLHDKYPNYHIDISADCYCDITSPTATKGNAVKQLAQMLNVNLKYAAVFGDAENDVSMLQAIKQQGGLAIAVGNAMPAVKENASYVTAPVTENGFAKAVDEIIENNKILK